MEKRLFLAVLLSLAVVFLFQSFFGPKTQPGTSMNQVALTSNTVSLSKPSADIKDLPIANTVQYKEEISDMVIGNYTLTVSNIGGSVKKIRLNNYNYEFPINSLMDISPFDKKQFSMSKVGTSSILLTHKSDDYIVQKQILAENFKLTFSYKISHNNKMNASVQAEIKPFEIDLSRLDADVLNSEWTLFEYVLKTDKNIIRKEQVNKFNDKWNKEENKNIQWLAFRDRYFVTLVEPKNNFVSYKTNAINEKQLTFSTNQANTLIEPGKLWESSYVVYAGPQRLDLLKQAKEGFDEVLVFSSWGWLDFFAKCIYHLLIVIHKVLPVWGLCIILVSFLIYLLMYPLTLKSMVSMKKMQALQPKMANLKVKYKDNPEKLNKEIVELYRTNNVNPLSGCLPMLLQMPIFVGLYQVLWRSIYFRGESFLWMKDLSMPDRLFMLPFSVPFLGNYFNILPILMIFIMLAQQIITLKNMAGGDPEQLQQQKFMAIFFPFMLGFIFYNFASGLNLYFVVFYVLSTLSQWHISRDTKAA